MKTKMAMMMAAGLLTGCSTLVPMMLGVPAESLTGPPKPGASHEPTTPKQWEAQKTRVTQRLAAIEGGAVVVAPTKLQGKGASVQHTFEGQANTCYHAVLDASFPGSASVMMGAATKTSVNDHMGGSQARHDKRPMKQTFCTDHAGALAVRVTALNAQGAINPMELHEYTIGVASVAETAEQTASRRERERAAYLASMERRKARLPWRQRLFFGTKPGPIGPFASVTFGMTEAEAKTATQGQGVKQGRWRAPGKERISMSYQLERGHVSGLRGYLYGANPRPEIERHWGPGAELYSGSQTVIVWFEPERGMRATLTLPSSGDQHTLVIEPYTPIEAVAREGELQGQFAGLLGMSVEDFKTKYSWRIREINVKKGEARVYLPPMTHAEYFSGLNVEFTRGKISAFELAYRPKLKADGSQDMYDALKAAFGEPREVKKSGKPVQFYKKGKPEITAWEGLGGLKVRVSTKRTRHFY